MHVYKKVKKRFSKKKLLPQTASLYVLVFNVIASILLIGVCIHEFSNNMHNWALVVACAIGLIETVLGVQGNLAYGRIQEQTKSLEIAVAELESLNKSMRAQRHDFKNHMQVVMSLIEMNEYAEAKKYLSSVNDDFAVVSRAMRTSIPSLNAFLSAKQAACLQQGIGLEMEVTSPLDSLVIEAWELCSIIGNLVDNAIDAVNSKAAGTQKNILINISDMMGSYHISIENNGPRISGKHMSEIFRPGYSTKSENRGVGLTITREVIEGAGGSLDVFSNDVITKFVVRLPKAAELTA